MGSQRGDDPKIETAPTVVGSVDAVAATHISTESGSPTQPGTDPTLATYDRGLPAVTPTRLVQVQTELYERLGELARGGLGKISRARDLRSGRIVAIKEVIGGGEDIAVRFAREAMITANLQHPAIVPVYEVGRWPNGEPFYAMKLVAGRPLNQVIDDAKDFDARLRLVSHVLTVADALAYAHGERVIHRDLKPHNVLCGAHGETVVIDWGLARRLDDVETSSQSLHRRISAEPGQTFLGAIMGTPSYMPPEQARGARVDERADVYSIGAILYHLLAGAPAYSGRTLDELLDKVKSGPPQPIAERVPEVPPDLAAIVERAMARDPEQRYPSAAELAHDLRRFTTGQLVLAHRYTSWQRITRFLARHRAASAAVAALIVVAVVAFVSVVGARDDARREAARAEEQRARADTERDEARKRLVDAHTDRARIELIAQHPATALSYAVAGAELAGLDGRLSYLAQRALDRLPRAKAFPIDEIRGLDGIPGSRDFVIQSRSIIARWNPETDKRVWEGPGLGGGDIVALDAQRLIAVTLPALVFVDAATGKVSKTIAAPNVLNGLLGIDVTKRWAAAATQSGVELFDLDAGTHVATIASGDQALSPIVSPDGMRLALGLRVSEVQDRIVLVDRKGTQLREICGNCRILRQMIGGFLVAEERDGLPPRAMVLDWNGVQKHELVPASIAEIGDVLASSDGKLVALLLADGMIELHELGKGLRWRHTISDRAYEARLDRHGRLWVLGTYGGLHVYDVATGAELEHWTGGGIAVRLSGDDDLVAIGRPSVIHAWRVAAPTVQPIAPTAARVRRVLFAEGNRMVAASDDGVLTVYEPDGRARELGRHGARITSVQVTRDNRVVTSSRDGTTVVRDIVSGAELDRYPLGPRAEMSSDGVHLVIGDTTGKVWLIDRAAKTTREIGALPTEIASVRWSPDGTKVAVLDQNDQLVLWSADGTKLKEWAAAKVGIDTVFSNDSRWVMRIGVQGHRLLSTVPGVADRDLVSNREYGMTMGIAWSRDDRLVALAGQGHLIVHEAATGKTVLSLATDTDLIGVTFSPDASLIYAGGLDRKVRVWDLARGNQQTELSVISDVYGLMFDPPGRRLAIYTLGATLLWNIAPLEADLPKLRAIVRCADPLDPLTGERHAIDHAACNAFSR